MTAVTAEASARPTRRPRRRWRWGLALLIVAGGVALLGPSPWPSALLIRTLFDLGAQRVSAALDARAPPGIDERHDLVYDAADPDARYDLYRPAAGVDQPAITIVWVHGGGWLAGSRRDVAGYARVLAGHGVAVVALDYSLAPAHRYPMPVRQVNTALGHLQRELPALGLDPTRIVLAGDSAGAQIAAQVAALTRSPDYAARLGVAPAMPAASLRAVLLYCGPYVLQWPTPWSLVAWFQRSMLRAYFGPPADADAARAEASVLPHLAAGFPPAFVSVGNDDPLRPHTVALAERLRAVGVDVEALLFAEDRQPPLPHEYQFDLEDEAGRLALSRSLAFARRYAGL